MGALIKCLVLSVLSGVLLMAAEGPNVPPADPGKPKAAEDSNTSKQPSDEEKWTFEPQINRKDIFYDLEAILALPNAETNAPPSEKGPNNLEIAEIEALRAFGRQELSRIEGFVLARKWDDALKTCESDLKRLQAHADDPAVIAITEKIKRYQQQANEAKTYEEAQAHFDALGLKVEGILWSATGSLAVISGEPRARGINDRVKDAVIINIEANRVDFLYHFDRRRFEFQRYVGEDVSSGTKTR